MKYIISGGGTGGHLYPGLTIADELNKKNEVLYIASKKGIDKNIINEYNPDYKIKYWNLRGFYRRISLKNILLNIINIFYFLICIIKSFVLIIRFKPDAVIGFGGYISFPIVFVASLFNIKTIIHEQNSYPGLVNRILSKYVDKIGVSYTSVNKYFDQDKIEYVLNPRCEIAKKYTSNIKLDKFDENKINILILGGSLGAKKINDIIVDISQKNANYIYHLVVGEKYYLKYNKFENNNLKIYKYITNIFDYMKQSDLVITRAGASTLLELVAMNKKILAIPSPNVSANHQEKNAKELADNGLINYELEKNITNEILLDKIKNILESEKINNMNNINAIQKMISLIEE